MLKIDWNPPKAQLRQFGWFALFGFPLIGVVFWWKFGAPDWLLYGLIGLGVLSLALAQTRAELVKPIFLTMMLIAIPIGFALSFLLMGLIYYGLFTPVGLVFRWTGRDKMHKHPDPAVPTYWHERGEPRPAASYYKLY